MHQTFTRTITDLLAPVAAQQTIADVRLGLKYSCVRLDNGACGVSWTGAEGAGCCGQNPDTTPLAGSPATRLLDMLGGPAPLQRTTGLAAANALSACMDPVPTTETDILDLLAIQPSDHVAMVGMFGPLLPPLRKTGCRLDVIELADRPGTLSPLDGKKALSACTVAIMTSTSVVTGTIDDLLESLGSPRAAVMLGPSTFMRPEVWDGTKITHLAGARVRDAEAMARLVSEGGGTKILKRAMDFRTIVL